MEIAGYKITHELHDGAASTVWRARRISDEAPVVLKLLKEAYPAPDHIAAFRREYEMLRSVDLPGVVRAHALERVDSRWMIVCEDFGGESLSRLGLAGKMSLPRFTALALSLAETLGALHQRHVMHEDVNPANIVLNP